MRWIAEALAAKGLDPILDLWEFVPGDSLKKSMDRGIASSTCFVLFWSKNSALSDNVDYERELGLAKLRRKRNFRVICVILDDTSLPAEHSFRLYVDWRSGKRPGAIFDRNLNILIRAVLGLPWEAKPRDFPDESDPIVKRLTAEILGGRNLLIAYQCPYRVNPITSRTLPTRTFFDDLAGAARKTGRISILDHNPDQLECPYVYLPSYNLAKIALASREFAELQPVLRRALRAYDAPYKSKLRKESPWRDDHDGGARFVSEVLSRQQYPVLGILRNIHWEVNGDTEPTYVFGDEIPALGLGISIAFDIWHADDWTTVKTLVDYFVDDRGTSRRLLKGQRERLTRGIKRTATPPLMP